MVKRETGPQASFLADEDGEVRFKLPFTLPLYLPEATRKRLQEEAKRTGRPLKDVYDQYTKEVEELFDRNQNDPTA